MRYWNRNLISATRQTVSSSNASGIYDLASHSIFRADGVWPVLGSLTTDGLALHLDAGDVSSYSGIGTTWSDLTSNGYDFTLRNSPPYSTSDGGYFSFDGASDLADTANTSVGSLSTNPFTIEVWSKADSYAQDEALLGHSAGGAGTYQLSLISDGGINIKAGASTIFNLGISFSTSWRQIVIVREGTGTNQTKSYLNGSYVQSGTLSDNMTPSSGTGFRIARNRGGLSFFDGSISIVRIYKNKALTAAEVSGNFAFTRARYGL